MIHYYRYLFVKIKVFNYSKLHFAEVTSYKIHTLTGQAISAFLTNVFALGSSNSEGASSKFKMENSKPKVVISSTKILVHLALIECVISGVHVGRSCK